MYIEGCIDTIMHLTNRFLNSKERVEIYNTGSENRVKVREIAEIVVEEVGNPKIKLRFTGGVDGGRGWKGDVKTMRLDMGKLLETGWKPKYTSKEAVKLTTKAIIQELFDLPSFRFSFGS